MRFVCSLAVVVAVTAPSIHAQVGDGSAERGRGTGDRARLIEGVREIGAPGAPGSLVVFTPTASAVVVGGAGGGSEVAVVATAHLGHGRTVAFRHRRLLRGRNSQRR